MKFTNINLIKEKSANYMVSKFFSKLFESRDVAHILHLKVNGEVGSFAAHMALGSYYEDIIGLIDDLIETYQGQYGLIEEYENISTSITKTVDKLEYFEELAKFIKDNRNYVGNDTHLQNIIDEITATVYRTIYKLKFLK